MNTVSIRPITEQDGDILAKILSCPEQTRFLPNEAPYSDEQQQTYLNNRCEHWQQHGFGSYIVVMKDAANTKLGFVGAELSPDPSFVDIRFALAREFSGQGYMTQACRLLLHQYFEHQKKDVLYGAAMDENFPSLAVLKKIGMQAEASLNFYNCGGLQYFSLTQEQYQDITN